MEVDILQEIPDEDMQLLSNKYKGHQLEAPHIYSLLNTYMSWKTKKPDCKYLQFFGIKKNWLETGTFILLIRKSCYDLMIFSLEKDCETLYQALIQTKKINWNQKVIQWYSVSSKHISIVLNVISYLKLSYDHGTDTKMWVIEKEKALQFQIECPDDVYISKLSKSHVNVVNEHWPHKYDGSEEYLSMFIEMNNCYGIFLKKNGVLVCWILKNHMGQMGILQTIPEHRKKGYAMLATKVLSKEIAEDGHDPLGTVLVGNIASEKMFKKLGFHHIDVCTYVECF